MLVCLSAPAGALAAASAGSVPDDVAVVVLDVASAELDGAVGLTEAGSAGGEAPLDDGIPDGEMVGIDDDAFDGADVVPDGDPALDAAEEVALGAGEFVEVEEGERHKRSVCMFPDHIHDGPDGTCNVRAVAVHSNVPLMNVLQSL